MEADPRLQRLSEPHVLPLMNLIESWRSPTYKIPNVDPEDGGINARALFLLESPGPKAVNSSFISRNNPDPSAANMAKELKNAGFSRADTLLWNVVPYCVSTCHKNQNATARQVREAVRHTQEFVRLLPDLAVIVLCGRRAQVAGPLLNVAVPVLHTFHPGARSYNHCKYRQHIQQTFAEAYALILRKFP